jgi:hypothetical protein
MQNEGWKGSRNDIVRDLRLNKRTVTDRLRLLESYNIIKIHEGKWQWFFEIMSPDQWNSAIKEAFNKNVGAPRAPSFKKKSLEIDDILSVHAIHHDRCTPCTGIGAPGAPHIYTKDLKTKEIFLEEEKGKGNA